jgi:hypothetical protein
VNAQCAKSCVSLLIAKSCNLAGVRASIDFDSQPYLGTIEINDEPCCLRNLNDFRFRSPDQSLRSASVASDRSRRSRACETRRD